MKIIHFIVFSLLMLHLEGQNHFIGIKAGPNWTTNAISGDRSKNEPRSGWEGGLTYEYMIDKHFSLGANIMYDQRGFGFRDTFLNYSGNPNLEDHIDEVAYHFDYLSVPIKAAYHIGSHIYGFVSLGLSPSLLIDGAMQTKSYNFDGTLRSAETQSMFDQMQKFDLSGLFEMGGGYKFKQRYWLFASLTYHYSFSSYYLSYSNSYNGENRHMGMNLALGLKYALTSYTQKQADESHVLDAYYLERSKSQKTIAKYLLYGGLGLAAVGGLVQLENEASRNGGFDLDFTGTWMAIGGGCVSLFSVPFFISSSVNARKAASLSLGDQAIFIPQLQSSVLKTVPSASLKLKF